MQNLMKEWKQLPIVIMQQVIFHNMLIPYLWLRIITRCDQGVQFMNFFFSQILFNDIKHGYRAAILKNFICGCVYFIWLWLLIAIMKRCAERCALQMSLISLTVNNRTTPVDNILESLLLTLCLFGNVTLIFCQWFQTYLFLPDKFKDDCSLQRSIQNYVKHL